MAKVVSPVWSIIRGSIAGTTYSTSPSGMIIARQRTMPVNPNSGYQQLIKAAMIFAAGEWGNTLLQADRDAWDNWASANGPLTGRQRFLAGQIFQQYMEQNAFNGWVSAATNLFAPDFQGTPAMYITPGTFAQPASTGVQFDLYNSSPHLVNICVELSPPQPQTVNFYKGPWDPKTTLCDQLVTSTTAPLKWDNLVEGIKYFARMRGVSVGITAGHLGTVLCAEQIVSAVAVTVP
jgi:hypothetical protein